MQGAVETLAHSHIPAAPGDAPSTAPGHQPRSRPRGGRPAWIPRSEAGAAWGGKPGIPSPRGEPDGPRLGLGLRPFSPGAFTSLLLAVRTLPPFSFIRIMPPRRVELCRTAAAAGTGLELRGVWGKRGEAGVRAPGLPGRPCAAVLSVQTSFSSGSHDFLPEDPEHHLEFPSGHQTAAVPTVRGTPRPGRGRLLEALDPADALVQAGRRCSRVAISAPDARVSGVYGLLLGCQSCSRGSRFCLRMSSLLPSFPPDSLGEARRAGNSRRPCRRKAASPPSSPSAVVSVLRLSSGCDCLKCN